MKLTKSDYRMLLYAHCSLIGLLYLTSNISRCVQKQIE